MRTGDVMAEFAEVMARMEGVRKTWDYPPDDIAVAPSGYVSYPQQGTYDLTAGRGEDGMDDLSLVLIAGEPGKRETHDRIKRWTSGSGSESLIERIEDHDWRSCDKPLLTTWEVIPETVAGAMYLAVMFKATVVGPGG